MHGIDLSISPHRQEIKEVRKAAGQCVREGQLEQERLSRNVQLC